MPLNLTVGDGDFTPYIKYNAKAGRWYVKPEGATEDVEIVNPTLAFDFANIKTGWLYYTEGAGPEKVWDPSPIQEAPRPPGPKKFKRGFEVMVFSNRPVPGTDTPLGLREFSSTAGNVIHAILQMYDEFEKGIIENPDCLPVFECVAVRPITGAYGTNYEPAFRLKQWVPRSKVPAFDEASSERRPVSPPRSPGTNGGTPPPVTQPPYPKTREKVTAGAATRREDVIGGEEHFTVDDIPF